MKAKKLLSIDFGKARVGVAVSDDLGLMAHARPFLENKSKKTLIEAICALAREEGVERILVGLPLEMTGEEGPAARRAIDFAHEVADASRLEVELVDERLTTVEASRQLRASGKRARDGKTQVDGVAAAVILQAWLDRVEGARGE